MTFIEFETSDELARPAELYDFRIGTDSFPFTSYIDPVTVAVGTFQPEAMRRSKLTQEVTNKEGDLDVTVPADNAFVKVYDGTVGIPGARPTLTLYRTHVNDPDKQTRVRFRGDVTNLSRVKDTSEVKIHVQSFLRTQARQIPRQTYRGLCTRSLYDDKCNSDGTVSDTDPAFEKFLNVSAVSADGLTLTVDTAGSFGDDFFQAGFVSFGGDFRDVISQGGVGFNDLQLIVPFQESPLDQTIRCLAGCQHRLEEDCQNKFNNTDNYGGTAFVPLEDIWTNGLD